MAFIDIFNYKKYFSSKGDSNVARIGHVNKLATRVTSPVAVTQTTNNNTAVTIDSYSGVITMFGTLAATTSYTFTVNNSFVTADSAVLLTIDYSSNADLSDAISYGIGRASDGSFTVMVRATTITGTPIKIHFLVIS